LRLYTFLNYYLSSIQQGIQSAHILGEIYNEANSKRTTIDSFEGEGIVQELRYNERDLMVFDWAENHKTMVVCNGGNNQNLRDLISFFKIVDNPYPWAAFYEDADSLDRALTGVGIILPESIYDVTTEYDLYEGQRVKVFVRPDGRAIRREGWNSYEYQLIDRIKSAPLAK